MYLISHFKKLDWTLIACVFLLSLISLLTIYSITFPEQSAFFKKQLLFVIAGFLVMFLLSFFDYRIFKNNSFLALILFALSLFLLGAVLIFGREIRGSTSWFYFGGFSFQPIEFVKIAIIIILAKYFSIRHIELYQLRHIIVSGIYIIVPAFLVLAQPDLGSATILISIWLGIILIAGIRRLHFFLLIFIGLLIILFGWFFVLEGYQQDRILSFLNPSVDPLGVGYNKIQSVIAIGSGGFWGKGVGLASQSQLGFLPESHTDFIFASFAEEWGFLGVVFLFAIFGILTRKLTNISLGASNNFAKFFVMGLMIMIVFQLAINTGMNMGILPITGIPFPFLSYGGSGLLAIFIALGVAQGIKVRSTLI